MSDAGPLFAVALSLLFTCMGLGVSAIATVVPIAAMGYLLYRLTRPGAVVLVPAVSTAAPAVPAAPAPHRVKRTRCRGCGAPKVQRTLSAYVYCDFCGALCDWDFQACLADKRSRLPGPAYEALLRNLGPEIERARASGDRAAYEAVQVKVYDAYANACPAALPPRIGDQRFRRDFVAWSAASQTLQDLDPGTQRSFAAQQEATRALQWDRSNPFSPRAEPTSFWRLMDAVETHQRAVVDLLERDGLLARHPDHPDADLFRRMGLSAMVQGWIPFLPATEVDRLLDRTGLRDSYDTVEPPSTRGGACAGCGARLEVVEGSKRVVCLGCGNMAGVSAGTLPCHGCGSPVEIPEGTSLFSCPACQAELRMIRWGA